MFTLHSLKGTTSTAGKSSFQLARCFSVTPTVRKLYKPKFLKKDPYEALKRLNKLSRGQDQYQQTQPDSDQPKTKRQNLSQNRVLSKIDRERSHLKGVLKNWNKWARTQASHQDPSLSLRQSITYYPEPVKPPSQIKEGIVRKIASKTSMMAPYKDKKTQPSLASGGVPNPTAQYLTISNEVPQPVLHPRHLLVVIDLNGTLLYRPNRKAPTKFTARPHAEKFLQYCVDTFTVIIWSSARQENVEPMCKTILTPQLREKVVAIWGRETFNLSPGDFNQRVQCYKRLTKLWTDPKIAASHPDHAQGGRWNQTNTVLIDDSSEKARSEPYNLIEIPEFFGNNNELGDILPQVHDYINFLSMHQNVSAIIRTQPFTAQAGNPHKPVGLNLPIDQAAMAFAMDER